MASVCTAEEITNYILDWNKDKLKRLTNWKLQNILFILQSEFKKRTGQRLIKEDFRVWKVGMYIPSVYNEYCVYASNQILSPYNKKIEMPSYFYEKQDIVDNILQKYMEYEPSELYRIVMHKREVSLLYEHMGKNAVINFGAINEPEKMELFLSRLGFKVKVETEMMKLLRELKEEMEKDK